MFGCLVSGRIVQTNAQQVDANRFIFILEKANQVQHLAVFLLGSVYVSKLHTFQSSIIKLTYYKRALPDGFGASIFLGWPPFQDWKYLGMNPL